MPHISIKLINLITDLCKSNKIKQGIANIGPIKKKKPLYNSGFSRISLNNTKGNQLAKTTIKESNKIMKKLF
tara:strand:+ start:22853 stop:23068 length:216 start_codon:yes stop_codon:yes gene_type:complete